MNKNKKLISGLLVTGIVIMNTLTPAFATEATDPIAPHKASYGYYVEDYQTNSGDNMSPDTNAAIGVLSGMLDYFTPGTEWNNGTILSETMHKMNLEKTYEIANTATQAQKDQAYLDDRRNQNYSMISGLGIYADEYAKGTNAKTLIPDEIPSDASSVQYNDDDSLYGSVDSTYGDIVNLIATVRNGAASTSSAKKYYKYMRPFRWGRLEGNPATKIITNLTPCEKSDPSNDGGYPSGHTNAAYLAAISMAYAVPEEYQQMLLRASDLGNNRIIAGMHSCLDVIGGRIMSSAIAAANLNRTDLTELKAAALEDGQALVDTAEDQSYETYQQDLNTYTERLTYGLTITGETNEVMRVPKGAEVLLESRLPYLDDTQRRYVLYTTGLPSGYSVLDDEEGWGRLNLFKAASGYGAFIDDVTVNMDAEKGGFYANDNWRNDITGSGSLTKNGTGSLTLSGNNSYSGTTTVNNGALIAANANSFGTGSVNNNSTITESTQSTVQMSNLTQTKDGVLTLNVSNADDILNISNQAILGGTLELNFVDGFEPESGFTVIKANSIVSQFDDVKITGLSNYNGKIQYNDGTLELIDSANDNTPVIDNTNHNLDNNKTNTVLTDADNNNQDKIADKTNTDLTAQAQDNYKDVNTSNPKTADHTPLALLISLMITSIASLITLKLNNKTKSKYIKLNK